LGPSSQQFSAIPRFNFSSQKTPTVKNAIENDTWKSRYHGGSPQVRLPPTQREQVIIDDSPDEDARGPEEHIDHGADDIDISYVSVGDEDDFDLDPPLPKRQRLSTTAHAILREEISVSSDIDQDELDENVDAVHQHDYQEDPSNPEDFEDLLASSSPVVSPPRNSLREASIAPRFHLPSLQPSTPRKAHTPAPSSTAATAAPKAQFLAPPRFQPTPAAPTLAPSADPLPTAFSPQRRGQKYVPGGLAAEAVGWLMGLEGTSTTGSTKILVCDVQTSRGGGGGAAGMTMIRGRPDTGGEVRKIILAGTGSGEQTLQRIERVEVGKVVLVKQPVWEITLEGNERWGVAVVWEVVVG
jgi:hypothetical protein